MAVTVREIPSYENYGRCVQVTNGEIEAYITVDLGPRIIRYGFVGGTNIMFNDIARDCSNAGPEFDRHYFKGAQWFIYGGHRLWVSPESMPESYYPDRDPVEYRVTEQGAVFTPKPQTENGYQFEIEVAMCADKNEMQVLHRVKNIAEQPREFAVWALTVLGKNGLEIIPQNTHDTGLLANRYFSVWPYADMQDPRFYFGSRYLTLRQDPSMPQAFKIGLDNQKGTGIYAIEDTVFIKRYAPNHPNGCYADNGMSYETYTNNHFLELETLGELKKVAPGETIEHTERWELRKNPGTPDARDEAAIDAFVRQVTE